MSIFLFYLFLKSFGQYEMDDRPTVTETDRGGVYEMDRQTNRQKREIIPFLAQRAKKASAKGQNPPQGRTF